MEMSQSSITQDFTGCQTLLPRNSINSVSEIWIKESNDMESISIEDGECSNQEKILNFLNAVKAGNIDQIRNLLSSSSSSSSSSLALIETNNEDNGDTPLHVAVMIGNFKVVKLILDHMMNINIIRHLLQKPNKKNNTVLHEAVKNGNFDIVKLLLEKDSSSVYSNNEEGESPLFLAIDRELYEIASHILSKIKYVEGILSEEKEGKDEHGWTPLHYAAHFDEFGLVNLFLSKHSLICCVQDNEGMSPLHIAAKNGSLKVLHSLKNGSGLYSYKMFELLDKNNRTTLHVAVESKNESFVERMLCFEETKYIINWKDKDGNTCFHLAALTKSHGMKPTWLMTTVLPKDLCWFKTSLESVHDLNGSDDNKLVPKEKEGLVSPESKQQRSNREIMSANLIVATIIASITYAAGIQNPGGYDDEGMANLADFVVFKCFIVFNSLGFGLSSASILLTFLSVLYSTSKRFRESISFILLKTVIVLTMSSFVSSVIAYLFATESTTADDMWLFASSAFAIPVLISKWKRKRESINNLVLVVISVRKR
ncbi:hypothetical protein F8388_003586 [Cannabis sativa]|uniref:PGG domain-containing protein n=1 Tax=Cannabis sativa TaxID=3483 RepID=A0A7J6EMF1_CANSA|nr:hypothetical protein F8388_003586 [Cannabis sativa]